MTRKAVVKKKRRFALANRRDHNLCQLRSIGSYPDDGQIRGGPCVPAQEGRDGMQHPHRNRCI